MPTENHNDACDRLTLILQGIHVLDCFKFTTISFLRKGERCPATNATRATYLDLDTFEFTIVFLQVTTGSEDPTPIPQSRIQLAILFLQIVQLEIAVHHQKHGVEMPNEASEVTYEKRSA